MSPVNKEIHALAGSCTEQKQQQMRLQHSPEKKKFKPSIAEYSLHDSPLGPLCCILFDE